MKKLIIGAALATLLASPVLAQSYSPGYGTGNVLDEPAARSAGSANHDEALKSHAQAPRPSTRHTRAHRHVQAPNG